MNSCKTIESYCTESCTTSAKKLVPFPSLYKIWVYHCLVLQCTHPSIHPSIWYYRALIWGPDPQRILWICFSIPKFQMSYCLVESEVLNLSNYKIHRRVKCQKMGCIEDNTLDRGLPKPINRKCWRQGCLLSLILSGTIHNLMSFLGVKHLCCPISKNNCCYLFIQKPRH